MKSKQDRDTTLFDYLFEPCILLIILFGLVGVPLIFKVRFLSALGVFVGILLLITRLIFTFIDALFDDKLVGKEVHIVAYVVIPAVAIPVGILVGNWTTACAGIWAADGTLLLLWFFNVLPLLLLCICPDKSYLARKKWEKEHANMQKADEEFRKKLEMKRRKDT